MDGLQDDNDLAMASIHPRRAQLSREFNRFVVRRTGDIISTHTNPKDDQTYCILDNLFK